MAGGAPSTGDPMSTAACPTGFAALDTALGIGGLPRGHIVEIFGPPNSGKTALALQTIAHLQQSGGAAAWIDAEHAFDPRFASQLGVDLAGLPVAEPGSAEEALEIARQFAASGAVELVVVDSAAALVPKLELETGLGDGGSLHGRVLASELRRLSSLAARTGVCVVFLNQIRGRREAARRVNWRPAPADLPSSSTRRCASRFPPRAEPYAFVS